MKNKTPLNGKFRICVVIAITILVLLSNFLMVEITPKENKNTINKEEIIENIENSKIENEEKIKQNLAKMKGFFTKNQGQLENDEIYFTYSASDKSFGFCESSLLIKLTKTLEDNSTKSSIVTITFENSNKIIPVGKEELPHKSNYFIGNDSTKWKSNVLNYEKIIYENLYDGIDLVYYFNEKGLKYDWVVKAGADPSDIGERFEGMDSIKKDTDGGLIVNTKTGDLKEEKPNSFQKIYDNQVVVDVSYKLIRDNSLIYDIGDYDSSNDLIIDPLIYSSYIGGEERDFGKSITLDSKNNIYITGFTHSPDFPTTSGCLDETYNEGWCDVFIFKMNSDGSNLVYSTLIGGNNSDSSTGIITDSENNVYITGETSSSNFPTTSGCYDNSYDGGFNDIFVLKLNSDGSNLIYSTFIGGSNTDYCFYGDIAIDTENNAYTTGFTLSSDFPTTSGCFDESHNGEYDVFLFKLNSDGSNLIYSTFIGGNDNDFSYNIALDSKNNAYVTGNTKSSDFPTTSGCFDDSYGGGGKYDGDVFVFKLNYDGSKLLYSTFVGGVGSESGNSIVLDSDNNSYITGYTDTTDFPTTSGSYDDSHNGLKDVFVFKLNNDGSNLIYSTFVGGFYQDDGLDIALDFENNVYITGDTKSSDFPTTSGCFDDLHNGNKAIFIFQLNSNGTILLYSTFIAGSDLDYGESIALDSENNIHITGYTNSSNFPTTSGCFDDTKNGDYDVFVLKLELPKPIVNITSPSDNATIDKTKKKFIIKGTASFEFGKITKVQIKIDDGEWQDAESTTKWSFKWDLTNVEEGNHTISVRAFDGGSYSKIVTINVIIEEKSSFKIFYILPIIGIIAVIGIIGYVLYQKKSSIPKTPPTFQQSKFKQQSQTPQFQQRLQFPSKPPQFQQIPQMPQPSPTQPIQQPQPKTFQQTQTCPYCNAQVQIQFKFCNMCGKQIKS